MSDNIVCQGYSQIISMSSWWEEVFIGGLHRLDLRICGCRWKVSGSLLGSGGKGTKFQGDLIILLPCQEAMASEGRSEEVE